MAAERTGLPAAGELAQFAHSLVAIGYSQDQESEADASGESLAIDAGYDPDAAAQVFRRMQQRFGEGARQPAATPGGEVAGAVVGALGSYFRTHPPSADRARQLDEMVRRNRRELAGRLFYKGLANYQMRKARSEENVEAESHVY
jgi:predicted Zn-dependent protease